MKTAPPQILNVKTILTYIFLLPVWLLFFCLVFRPAFSGSHELVWNSQSSFRLIILMVIAFGVMASSRLIMFFVFRDSILSRWEYFYWQLFECLAISLFADLFLSLNTHEPFFLLLPPIFMNFVLIFSFPYIVLWLYLEKGHCEIIIEKLQGEIDDLNNRVAVEDKEVVRFPDEKGTVKIALKVESVLYLESSGNYVSIVYEDGSKIRKYDLRNTLKGIEELCEKVNLLRCHRSYLVNMQRIKLIKKSSDGVFAELDTSDSLLIPVSKTYSGDIMKMFSYV